MSALDRHYLDMALALANQGLYSTMPNPRVGCVIVNDGQVVGRGWHQRAGHAHAEVHALQEAGPAARGATAYVTLEPCGHHGRTPPCADALVAAGVRRVVTASADASQSIGALRLREAGIAVEAMPCPTARALNRGFFSRIERQRPWVRVLRPAALAIGAMGEGAMLSHCDEQAPLEHWRGRASALLTTCDWVKACDPSLLAQVPAQRVEPVTPLRVVVDQGLDCPASAKVLDGLAPTLVLHAAQATRDGRYARARCQVIEEVDARRVLQALYELDCNEVQVEAQPAWCKALARQGLVDEWLVQV
ncbi:MULTISPECIES: bifunctional diaminohydroxyphosphoribosylaminopyrimidine deaminase/5-amino-6-(5-phosphoribosylamino)uracil reductase RibD [unclassified Pseudomonas]|uniref:bifunctional diaminohydroxyphosphoribosylaminopyrimidine deaminase/5-amino-6-(5-phosphoribosylamino)uracil reductase RibD n=1 Tax=unclassified Pseudomonas TaxID=196821 RepID=UPI000C886238|nr:MULTISPECIES: bifunctional diaminohydroxyphosphoribosylaminopyrimidine deaminase/5-amino-6-(5-phosphoribosylamino)uracil reductase RibD [unclassified Pseudomonas]PMZ89649.1 bifunctional diaminohydroxyphosphoribosylaminopyrimidine deaminase/5-amino-6-(5-phosphoribosylamino)uracil reductase RibD [Pseudomonas sp. FW305-42]PNA23678.1 bifunctional diaminohydroxyphosphoribosylaminopyrimidine deaminase/5-amino-6-(5-phosphoribosylamino)uracil reductase RibD [Pseudomonas sp. MPR-R1B]PNB26340.1 bifunct